MQSFKVGIGCNFFDDPHGLKRLLDSGGLHDFVHTVFLIDGRYAQRNDTPEHDPALVDAIIKQYDKIHYLKMFDYKQIDKRNKYWQLAEEYDMDYMIVIDSDEYAVITPDVFNQTLNECWNRDARCFPLQQDHPQVIEMPRPRLFKKPFNYRHRESQTTISHGSLYDGNDKEIINEMYQWFKDHPKRTGVPGIRLFHDKAFRTESRIIKDRVYYDNVKNR